MKLPIRVIDLPHTATAEECERLLARVVGDGYYLITLTPHMTGTRGYFRQRVRTATPEETTAAADLLRSHPHTSSRQAAQMLADHGFTYKKDWVLQQRSRFARESQDAPGAAKMLIPLPL